MTTFAITTLLVLAGAIHALSFAIDPLPAWLVGPTNIVTISLLITTIWMAPNQRAALWRGWVFGVSSFCVGLYWLTISMHISGQMPLPLAGLALFALCAYLAIYPAMAAHLAYRFRPSRQGRWVSLLTWAAVWTLAEWLRGHLFTGFPWLNTGYSQLDTYLGSWGVIGGIYTVGFVTALLAAAVALVLVDVIGQRLPTRGTLMTMGCLCLVTFGAGKWFSQHEWTTPVGAPLAVRLVQGGVEQDLKFDPKRILLNIDKHRVLASSLQQNGPFPRLVLIPETAMTVFQDQVPPAVWQTWVDLAAKQRSTIMLGVPLIDRPQQRYTNSVLGVDQDTTIEQLMTGQTAQRYDKHHLVPFGEFIPWGFRWFVDLLHIPLGDFNRGAARQRSFIIDDQRVGPNICYEDIFGEEIVNALNASDQATDATMLANFSNLAWFGDSWALRQHWQMARMRALESSRPMLRATNTGVTGGIDQHGETLGELPTMRPGILDLTAQGQEGRTPYVRVGNLPVVLLSLCLLIVFYFRTRQNR